MPNISADGFTVVSYTKNKRKVNRSSRNRRGGFEEPSNVTSPRTAQVITPIRSASKLREEDNQPTSSDPESQPAIVSTRLEKYQTPVMHDDSSLGVQAMSYDTTLEGSNGLTKAVSKKTQATVQKSTPAAKSSSEGPDRSFGREEAKPDKADTPSAEEEHSNRAVGPEMKRKDEFKSGSLGLDVSSSSNFLGSTPRATEAEEVNRGTEDGMPSFPRYMPKVARRESFSPLSSHDRKLMHISSTIERGDSAVMPRILPKGKTQNSLVPAQQICTPDTSRAGQLRNNNIPTTGAEFTEKCSETIDDQANASSLRPCKYESSLMREGATAALNDATNPFRTATSTTDDDVISPKSRSKSRFRNLPQIRADAARSGCDAPALPPSYKSPYLKWDSSKQTHVMCVRGLMLPVSHVCTVGNSYFAHTFYEHYLSPWGPIIVTCRNTFLPGGMVNSGYYRSALVYPITPPTYENCFPSSEIGLPLPI